MSWTSKTSSSGNLTIGTMGTLPTTSLKTYRHRRNAERRAEWLSTWQPMRRVLIETPHGFAALRADQLSRYDTTGVSVLATLDESGEWRAA